MAKLPSQAVLDARARRKKAAARDDVRIEWMIEQVNKRVDLSMKQRMRIATTHLRDAVVKNISRPVTKGINGRVTDRSKPGEFPKADTTNLMKSIFEDVRSRRGKHDGYVGTTSKYGAILEVSAKLNRSFLIRTLREEMSRIRRLLTRQIK